MTRLIELATPYAGAARAMCRLSRPGRCPVLIPATHAGVLLLSLWWTSPIPLEGPAPDPVRGWHGMSRILADAALADASSTGRN